MAANLDDLVKAARMVIERWESGDLAEAVRELDAELQEIDTPREPKDTDLVCQTCGCDECQGSAWIVLNTGELTNDEGPTSENWCPVCEDSDAILIERHVYQSRRVTEKRRATLKKKARAAGFGEVLATE